MKIRFEVDQAESFRRGIDAPSSLVILDIDPSELSPGDRDLLAQRLKDKCGTLEVIVCNNKDRRSGIIQAPVPTLEGLIEAVRSDAGQRP